MMLDRRTLLKRAGLASAGLLIAGSADLAAAARRAGLMFPTDLDLSLALAQDVDLPGMPPAITPTDRFYTVSKNTFSDPTIDAAGWRLRVGGSVGSTLDLDLDAIRAFPGVRQVQTLECIDNVVGGDLISNAEWTGVRLTDVLGRAGLRDSVRRIVFQCEDDYSDSIPIEKAMEATTLLAFEMNGQPLPRSHGFPVRLLAPNLYGIKNPKWITEIRAVDGDYRGFWQRRGWTNDGTIKTMSRIDVPSGGSAVGGGTVRIGGIAFAGGRGIQAVEISADQGRSWSPATLAGAMTPIAWRLWTADWQPQAGTPSLTVRAIDGTGAIQIADVRPALPDGSSGYHTVTVRAG
jgi:DMSO/TMAO reductase YedYZ molybdopterin-dependent catalytic subunit